MQENIDPSLKQLRDKLTTEFNFAGAELLVTKAQVNAVYEALKAKTKEEVIPVNDNIKEDIKQYESKAQRMKRLCESEPKVRFMIPLDIGEKMGAVMEMQINGYKLNILKGVMVDIPQRFATLYEQSLSDTNSAGKDMLMDRDEKVKDVLS